MANVNIRDSKYVDLSYACFIKPNGDVVFGYHANEAAKFFGKSSALTEREKLEAEKNYLMFLKFSNNPWDMVEFMIRFYGWDKVCIGKKIESAKPNIYETYFNYYMDGFNLVQRKPLVYNKEQDIILQEEHSYMLTRRDLEFKTEADEILATVPDDQISLFYR